MASPAAKPLPASQIFISDSAVFERKKAQLLRDGPEMCQVIADFDRTLTTSYAGMTRSSFFILLPLFKNVVELQITVRLCRFAAVRFPRGFIE